jgi:hypothetical protein
MERFFNLIPKSLRDLAVLILPLIKKLLERGGEVEARAKVEEKIKHDAETGRPGGFFDDSGTH